VFADFATTQLKIYMPTDSRIPLLHRTLQEYSTLRESRIPHVPVFPFTRHELNPSSPKIMFLVECFASNVAWILNSLSSAAVNAWNCRPLYFEMRQCSVTLSKHCHCKARRSGYRYASRHPLCPQEFTMLICYAYWSPLCL
jgi:hypothetical protein